MVLSTKAKQSVEQNLTRRLSVSKEIRFKDTVAYLENSESGPTKAPWLLYGEPIKPVGSHSETWWKSFKAKDNYSYIQLISLSPTTWG